MQWKRVWLGAAVAAGLCAGVALGAWAVKSRAVEPEAPTFETPYQAVLLTSGSVYFGKLEGLGTPYPVLKDVFYIQNTNNPETKQTSSVLVKRGRELHSPNRMVLNAAHILLIEPVGQNSRVAELIAKAKE